MRDSELSLVLSVPEAAAMLGLSVRSTYTLCHRADFPAIRLTQNRIGVSRAGLERWIEKQTGIDSMEQPTLEV